MPTEWISIFNNQNDFASSIRAWRPRDTRTEAVPTTEILDGGLIDGLLVFGTEAENEVALENDIKCSVVPGLPCHRGTGYILLWPHFH